MNPFGFLAPVGVGIAVLLASPGLAATNSLPLSAALGLGTSNTRGFVLRTVQAPPGIAVDNTLARALSQLNGTLGDPNGNPLPNDAVPGPLGGGAYPVDTVNFEVDGNPFDLVDPNGNVLANFSPALFPGIPGLSGSRDGFAVEVVGFVRLPAGITTFGVSVGTDRTDLKDDDSYVVYVGRNPRDAFNLKIGEFERFAPPLLDNSKNENPFSVDAPVAGLYPLRLVYWQTSHGANLQWYSILGDGRRPLLNDANDPDALPVYSDSSVADANGPFIAEVSPPPGSDGINPSAPVTALIMDGATTVAVSSVKLIFNGAVVAPQSLTKSGDRISLRYDPDPTRAGPGNTVKLDYTDSAAVTRSGSWSFAIPGPPTIGPITADGGVLIIPFSGQLESASSLAGPYAAIANAAPPTYVFAPSGPIAFFRSSSAAGVSSDTVGYIQMALTPGFNLIANPFDNGQGNRVSDLLGTGLPNGTRVCKFSAGSWSSLVFDGVTGLWIGPTLTLAPGEGAFVQIPPGNGATVRFLGRVIHGTANNPPLPPVNALGCWDAFSARRFESGTPDLLLGRPVANGGTVLLWNAAAAAYDAYNYDADFDQWAPQTPNISIGHAALICEAGGGNPPDPNDCPTAYTFINPAGGNWSTAANWSPVGVPGAPDTATIGGPGAYTVTLDVDVTVAGLAVGDGTGSPTLKIPGHTLTLPSLATVAAGGTLSLSAGKLTGSGVLTVAGVMEWTGGSMGGLGTTIIAGPGTLNLSGSGSKRLGRTLRNDGTVNCADSSLEFAAGTFYNNGTFTASSDADMRFESFGGLNSFNNSIGASFIKQGAGSASFRTLGSVFSFVFNNTGNVEVKSGTLELSVGGFHFGSFNVGGGSLYLAGPQTLGAASLITGNGSLILGGAITDAGTVNLGGNVDFGGGTATFKGPFAAGAVAVSGGTVTFDGTFSTGSVTLLDGTLDLSPSSGTTTIEGLTLHGGTLTGSADVTVTGLLEWEGGAMAGAGTTIIAGPGTLSLSGGATKNLNRALRNDGTANWTDGLLGMVDGTIENHGTFVANSAGDLRCEGNGGNNNAFNNAAGAAFIKKGTGVVRFRVNTTGVSFNNDGTVDVRLGTLGLDAGGTHAGGFTVGAGALLRLNGTHQLGAASNLTGAGTFRLSGGQLTDTGDVNFGGDVIFGADAGFPNGTAIFDGLFTVGGTMSLFGGTVTGSADITVTGVLNWTDGTMDGTGRTIIASPGTVNLIGFGTKQLNRMLRNDGTANWTDGLLGMVGGTIENHGTFVANSAGDLRCEGNGGNNNAFNNQAGATFIKAGTGLVRFRVNTTGVSFNNSGTVVVQSGTLGLDAGGTHSGGITMGGGALVRFAGIHTLSAASDIIGAGSLRLSGGQLTDDGNVDLGGDANFGADAGLPSGHATFNGSFQVGHLSVSGGTVDLSTSSGSVVSGGALSGGTLTGAADVTVTGVLDWTGGTMGGTGTTAITAAGTLNLNGTAETLNRTLRNDGAVNWTDGILVMTGARFDNYGNFTANSSGILRCEGIGGNNNSFNNQAGATFTKQGSGTARFRVNTTGVRFSNRGTLDLQAGRLGLEAGFVAGPDSRTLFRLAGLNPPLDYGVLDITGTANLAGTMEVVFAPGYVPAPGDLFEIVDYTAPGTGFSAVAGEANQFDLLQEPTRLRLRGKPGLQGSLPPVITQQPGNRAAAPGDTVVLNVVATGSPAPSYQWRRNGQNLPGETGPQLVLIITGPENAGDYTCIAYNETGAVLSSPGTVTVAADPLPFADNFAGRGEITSLSGVGVATNTAATREPGEPLHAGKVGGTSVWVRYLAPATGTLELSTLGSDFDTLLAVYTGARVDTLTPEAGDDDSAGFYNSRVRLAVTAGVNYAIAVDGRSGATGHLALRWTLTPGAAPPPRVIVAPNDQLARLGSTAFFSVFATGTTSFQWFRNGVALVDTERITGSSGAVLVITGVAIGDIANYAVELRGDGGIWRTPTVGLQVNPAAPAGVALSLPGARDKFSDLLDDRASIFLPQNGTAPAERSHPHPAGVARGIAGTQMFSSFEAHTEPGEPLQCGVVGGASLWLYYVADFDGTLTVDTEASLFDTVLSAYFNDYSQCGDCTKADILATLTPLACNNDVSPFDHRSRITFAITNLAIYTLVIDGVNGATGLAILHYEAKLNAPTITGVGIAPDGRLRFHVNGSVGQTVRVESSTDLNSFTPVLTTNLPVGGLPFTDPLPGTAGRFFRAVSP